jgi:hypothetical protein|tara:strand:+ start:653 stop:1078 length:426 start_codon:yes stop_codon:yes gene_type:complete
MTKDTNTPTIETPVYLMDTDLLKSAKTSLEYALAPQKVLRRAMLTVVCDLLKEALTTFPKLSDTNRSKMVDGVVNSYVREFTNGGNQAFGLPSKVLFVTTLKTVFSPEEYLLISKGGKMQEVIKSIENVSKEDDDASEWER